VPFVVNVESLEGMVVACGRRSCGAGKATDAVPDRPGRMPKISTAFGECVAEHFSTAGKNIVIPSYQGRRGHPWS